MAQITFIERDGRHRVVDAPVGATLLAVARLHGIDIEGACDGSLSCSTCHLIVDAEDADRLLPPTGDEEDMLDLAWGLTPNSRLGCQIRVTEELDGITVTLPGETRNMMKCQDARDRDA